MTITNVYSKSKFRSDFDLNATGWLNNPRHNFGAQPPKVLSLHKHS
jgi:hypothetical protein